MREKEEMRRSDVIKGCCCAVGAWYHAEQTKANGRDASHMGSWADRPVDTCQQSVVCDTHTCTMGSKGFAQRERERERQKWVSNC